MPRFDRYLLSQLLSHFGFFALVLVGVYWINRAVVLFDQLIGDGQSILVFLEFSLLTLPSVISLVLPIAAFIASVYVANKLIAESEIVVMQATGFSPFRMARPVLFFGLIVTLMMSALVHFLVPMSRSATLSQRATMSENITARFLTDGQFTHAGKNVTFYINDVDASGQLHDLLLEDRRNPDQSTTYTASKALFVKGDAGPKLIMFDGMAQTVNRKTKLISITRFADFTYDLGMLLTGSVGAKGSIKELSTFALLRSGAGMDLDVPVTDTDIIYEVNSRIAGPFLSTSVALIGFATLLLGGFSRLGLWRQISFAVVILVVIQGISTLTGQMGATFDRGWSLAYVAPLVGLATAGALLWWAGRPTIAFRSLATVKDAQPT